MNDSAEQMEKVTQGLIQACDEINANCCKSVDTAVEVTSAVSKGCNELSHNLGNLARESMQRAIDASKTMIRAKSVKELAESQTEFTKSFFDSWMASAGKLSEISARMTQEAFEPVARHANDAMSKVAQKSKAA